MAQPDVLVIGSGIYGAAAALEFHQRGHQVVLLDQGAIPHPLASSTDISKVIRMEYGADTEYMALVDEAIDGWHRWNEELGETLYHEIGVTMFTRAPMQPGGFEHESYHNLQARGRTPERLDASGISSRFPAWKAGSHVDGFFHARGGFAESGRVVTALCEKLRQQGVTIHENQTAEVLDTAGGRIAQVTTREGETFSAGHVVVAAGAWTPWLVPELRANMKATGHPVFHFRPPDPDLFTPDRFVVFTADISATGWYGFPVHPREGVVKIANHGVGVDVDPENSERVVTEAHHAHLREFLEGTFPALLDAPIVYTRLCLYSDTLDEHLWIARHPDVENLTVAAGGSGHAFKMGPVLGGLIADASEGKASPYLARFAWRDLTDGSSGKEEARYHGD
jgi:glycine/D-amino acid oxidase-like deaminating enzyme